jgi:hypothetical protein
MRLLPFSVFLALLLLAGCGRPPAVPPGAASKPTDPEIVKREVMGASTDGVREKYGTPDRVFTPENPHDPATKGDATFVYGEGEKAIEIVFKAGVVNEVGRFPRPR